MGIKTTSNIKVKTKKTPVFVEETLRDFSERDWDKFTLRNINSLLHYKRLLGFAEKRNDISEEKITLSERTELARRLGILFGDKLHFQHTFDIGNYPPDFWHIDISRNNNEYDLSTRKTHFGKDILDGYLSIDNEGRVKINTLDEGFSRKILIGFIEYILYGN